MKESIINCLIKLFGREIEIKRIDTMSVYFVRKEKVFRIWYKTKFVEEIEEERALPVSKEARAIGLKIKEYFSEKEGEDGKERV